METNAKNILRKLLAKLKSPWSISFFLYFVFFVVLIGGLGVIFSFFQGLYNHSFNSWNIIENIITYSITLAFPAAIPLLQSIFKTENKVSLIILILSSLLLIIGLSIISYIFKIAIPALICLVISWIIWIIANSENKSLQDKSFNETIKADLVKHGNNWD